MLIALVDNERQLATEDKRGGICPWCEEKVYSRSSVYFRPHWTHFPDHKCNSQEVEARESNSMTPWHEAWQKKAPEYAIERWIGKDTQAPRRADVVRLDGTVIEFQHSTISKGEIQERERDYATHGRTGVWVVDMVRPNGVVRQGAPAWITVATWPVLFDWPDEDTLKYANGFKVSKDVFIAWMNGEIDELPAGNKKRLKRKKKVQMVRWDHQNDEEACPRNTTLFAWQLEDTAPQPPTPITRCRACHGHGRPGWVRVSVGGRYEWQACPAHLPLTSGDPNFPRATNADRQKLHDRVTNGPSPIHHHV